MWAGAVGLGRLVGGRVSATRSPCGRRLSAPGLLWALAVMMAMEGRSTTRPPCSWAASGL